MTLYYKQILKIRDEIYPHESLVKQIVQAKQFIDVHFANNICLADIAGEALYSKFHFIRIFKLCYGRTPHQYLITVRINKAKELLQDSYPIKDVCFSVGFDSVTSFSGLFKKITGSAPSTFVNNQKRLNAVPGN